MNTLDQLARVLAKAAKRRLHSTYVSERDFKNVRNRLQKQFGTPRLPPSGQRIAVAPQSQKIAALFFDSVWALPGVEAADSVPEDLAAYGGTPTEIWVAAAWEFNLHASPEESIAFFDDLRNTEFARRTTRNTSHPARAIAEALSSETGASAVPVFANAASCSDQYRPGRSEVLFASLAEIELVDDRLLTWEQVREIRADAESRRDIRQLFHWLDREMVDKPVEYIAAALDSRLESYRVALKKHGVVTGVGVLECLLDPKFITSATVIATGGGLLGQATMGVVGAAALTIGNVVCSVVRNHVNLIDTRKDYADIAFIHELSKLVEPKKPTN